MKTIRIHGKPYVMVKDRIIKFHEDYPNGSIETELIEMTDRFIFKAKVTPDVENPQRYFTGHAEEMVGSSQINNTSALENCETSAIGRALSSAGYFGTEFCSANELENALVKPAKKTNQQVTNIVEKYDGEVIGDDVEPKIKNMINFGKHRGIEWKDVPEDYINWVSKKSNVEWQREEADKELERRKGYTKDVVEDIENQQLSDAPNYEDEENRIPF